MLQFILDTLLRTADLAPIALGLSLVYGLVRFANVAHVQYAMVGSFMTAALLRIGCPFLLAIVLASERHDRIAGRVDDPDRPDSGDRRIVAR
ncbi:MULTISPECIES: hypothetical protein [Lonsdalea]|uniref:hypothetical protein n=1 Tax=Lonsdalea TaxID=1082702 RepID=UPI0021AC901D|nr:MULTISPECIES: hypothetical protein [Lonsdalea]